jgi:hypothetical protein
VNFYFDLNLFLSCDIQGTIEKVCAPLDVCVFGYNKIFNSLVDTKFIQKYSCDCYINRSRLQYFVHKTTG